MILLKLIIVEHWTRFKNEGSAINCSMIHKAFNAYGNKILGAGVEHFIPVQCSIENFAAVYTNILVCNSFYSVQLELVQ